MPPGAADESSPLLTRDEDTGERNIRGSFSFNAIPNQLAKTISRATGYSVAVEDGDEFDTNQLIRHRSRLNSYPTAHVPEHINYGDDHDEDAHLVEAAAGQGAAEGGIETGIVPYRNDPGVVEKESKYVGVSTSKFWFIFSTILLGYFVCCFDISLMASSHPVITSYFDASNEASWLTTAFMITNTGFQPLWGRLSDTIGRKAVYSLVLLIFALTNLWCGLSMSIGSFIAARAVCGIGAGGTMSMGLVITNDLVKIEHRGIYISHINLAFGLGSACGAAFGGILCDTIGWRWAFGLQVPIILICGIGGILTLPNRLGPYLIAKQRKSSVGDSPAWLAIKNFDHSGVITLVFAVAFLILFFNIGGNEYPWSHPIVIVCVVLGVVLSGVVIWIEGWRAKQPIMPLHLLWQPPYMNLTFANFLASISSNTVLFNAPLWFQAVELTTPSASGLRLTAPAIGGSMAGIATGFIITYSHRLKPMLVIGAVVYLAGSIALCFINPDMSEAVKVVLITPTPLSQGFIYPASMMSAFAVSSTEDQAVVTTTLSLWRNLGIVIGVAISSLVFQNMLRVNLEKNVHGPEARKFIEEAIGSVASIKKMPVFYRDQVRLSYAGALKSSFITAVVSSALLLLLMLPMRLPRLKGKPAAVGAGE